MYFPGDFYKIQVMSIFAHKHILFACLLTIASACGSEEHQTMHCVDELSIECTPLYAPTFDNIYTNTLQPKCAIGGTSCHGDGGSKGGLSLEGGADRAYEKLLNPDSGSPRVVPGDWTCSHLIYHLESEDAAVVMPPGGPLAEEERCAIRQWIANGALRVGGTDSPIPGGDTE